HDPPVPYRIAPPPPGGDRRRRRFAAAAAPAAQRAPDPRRARGALTGGPVGAGRSGESLDDLAHEISGLGGRLAHLDAGGLEDLLLRLGGARGAGDDGAGVAHGDRKSTRLNSSHVSISYAVFCLKKK